MTVLEVIELALERARLGSASPMNDVARAYPDAPVDEARRTLDGDPGLYARARSGDYEGALALMAQRLRPPRPRRRRTSRLL